jgi:hypothetical protein
MKNKIAILFLIAAATAVFSSCQKMDKPELGEVITDDGKTLPEGPLRFYAGFNKTDGPSARWNAYDSISESPALLFPLSYSDGINGKALQGKAGEAALYLNANDFGNATSFTIAFWFKRAVNSNAEFFFSLKDDRAPYSGWARNSMFMMAEKGTPTAATVKVYLMDQWLEFPNSNQLKKPFFDGNWHHWAMTYDETTSKMNYYFDGALVTDAPASATDVKNAGNPRGALDLKGANNLIIGGTNKHVGLKGPSDDWMKSFEGSLDQFRMYNALLPAAEIKSLFDKKQ